jgi:hypothetical protein
VLYFARFNHWHGSPWHFVADGNDFDVRETSSSAPDHPAENSVFRPEKAFPNWLNWTWSMTKGADLMWTPISFQRSFRMAYSRTHYGTGYYIYHQFVDGIPLSHPIRSWNTNIEPDREVLELIARAGTDLAPKRASEHSGTWTIEAGSGSSVEFSKAPAVIRALEFSVPRTNALEFGRARLKIFWDGRPDASVNAPVALFFGSGTLYNRDNREYLVKAFPVNIRYDAARVYLSCYFPMPFFKAARIELLAEQSARLPDVHYRVRTIPTRAKPANLSYFHATYRDFPQPEPGKDLVLLDTRGMEGSPVWSGHFIGNSWIFSDRANLATLEGDPRFFFDDSQTPQGQGTGTEEWGGGGDYWGGQNMTLPFAGHPVGSRSEKEAKNDEDKIESAYRFLLADLMPFGRNALIQLEHGGENQSTQHYQTVTYWYGLPAASLKQTDELKVGDEGSKQSHHCFSPEASVPYEITSRYEWGVDTLNGQEIYPAHTEKGRKTRGTSEFELGVEPKNFGVLLRRTLDYELPNQKAEVFVSDAGGREAKWRRAGTWYLAGGNTCVYSNPKGELAAAEHHPQTSNRRFRDDEFLIPKKLTEGRRAIRVRLNYVAVPRPLYPGAPVAESAWSEIKYSAYCFVLPDFSPR